MSTNQPQSNGVVDLLTLAQPHLVPALTSPQAMTNWRRRIAGLSLTDHILLECCLGDADDRVDLHLKIFPGTAGHDFLLAANHPAGGYPMLAGGVISDFANCWANETLSGNCAVGHLWLSLDSDQPAPLLYLRSDRLSAATAAGLLAPLLPLTQAAALRAMWAKAETSPTYVGLIPRSEPYLVRSIWYVSPAVVADLLEAIGWLGDRNEVTHWLLALGDLVPTIGVVVDLDDGPLPQLGLEFLNDKQPEKVRRWASALEQLVATGLCTPARRAALLDFAGFSAQRLPQTGGAAFQTWVRKPSHLKLSLKPKSETVAKGYVSLKRGWLFRSVNQ